MNRTPNPSAITRSRSSLFRRDPLCLSILISIVVIQKMASSSVISPTLIEKLEAGGTSTVIIKIARDTQEALDAVEHKHFASRDERANAVTSGLQALAKESQKHIKDFLDAQTPPVKYESMWISNTLVVYEATLDLVKKLEALGGIKEIREEQTAHIMKTVVKQPKN